MDSKGTPDIKDLFKRFHEVSESFDRKKGIKCWQFINCPKDIMSQCPAVLQNAERKCWLVAGSLSGRKDVPPYCAQLVSCKQCDFYKSVKQAADEHEADKVTILIVEDEAIVSMEIQERVKRLGYRVCDAVSNGEQAVKTAGEKHPDLVLMDIRIEGQMDGIEAAQIIQKQFRIPVVYLTANSDDNTLLRAKLTEPSGFILKPFHERDLRTNIELALYKHKMAENSLVQSKIAYRLKNRTIEEANQENMKLADEIIKNAKLAMNASPDAQKDYLKRLSQYAESLNARLQKKPDGSA
uniref:Two component signal transduction response regulator n=1 Tax=uncultured Nitrospirae bacterium MY2-1F TaxID=798576 RepID=D9MNY4_9BACT|nr:two component signal transduction response regulator [uncultured Nitrospirae bacterium MY2-1F]